MKICYNPEIRLQNDYDTEEVYRIEDNDGPDAIDIDEIIKSFIHKKEQEENTQYGMLQMPPKPYNFVYYKRNSHSNCRGIKLNVLDIFLSKDLDKRILYCLCSNCASSLILYERKKEKPSAVSDKGT